VKELEESLAGGGLDSKKAQGGRERTGTYGLPFGVELPRNGKDHLVPMAVEEPSVVAAASNAARMVRASGGFTAEVSEALMTGQVQLVDVPSPARAIARLVHETPRLLELARQAVPNLVARGGGPRELEVRSGAGCLVHVRRRRDAMGANSSTRLRRWSGARRVLGRKPRASHPLESLRSAACSRASCPPAGPRAGAVGTAERRAAGSRDASGPAPSNGAYLDGGFVADRIVLASRFAELDPYRAATHNKGLMNGVDAVVLASGNDFRAVEAGAHAYAARSGRYAPLAVWRRDGEDLVGELEMPLALGTVGGTLRVHPLAQTALRLMHVTSADELSMVAASVGLASNLAALRALATEGIQRGHMSLHARLSPRRGASVWRSNRSRWRSSKRADRAP
jgi:hydroxymethylglutaryl-CoA reductase